MRYFTVAAASTGLRVASAIGLVGTVPYAVAQVPSIHATRNVHVSAGADAVVPHVEPHLAVNPRDPRNMVVAAMAFPRSARPHVLRVYVSRDGGESWRRVSIEATDVPGGDPWLAFGPEGTLYLAYLNESASLHIRRSDDGGQTWSAPTIVPRSGGGAFDYEKLIVDDTNGPRRGWLYVWSAENTARTGPGWRPSGIALSVSSDSARTFRNSAYVLHNNFGNTPGSAVITSGGTFVGAFHEIEVNRRFLDSPRLWVVRSDDGGATISHPFLVTENFRADSPHLAIDRSAGPFRDRIYASWSAARPELGMFVSTSEDRGATWRAAVRINDVPYAPGAYLHHPMGAVDANGVALFTFQDPRPDAARCHALYTTATVDGGATFLPNVRVSAERTCSDTPANRVLLPDSAATAARRFGDGGDYHGLVALPSGGFQAVWADSRTGVFQLWTARLTVTR